MDDENVILDEVIVLLMKAPKSYTCEDVVEIDAHGGPFVIKKILELLIHHGATCRSGRIYEKSFFKWKN